MNRFLLFLQALLISMVCAGQSFDELIKERVTAEETPGIAVGIFENGKTTFYTYGVADITSQKSVTTKTLFEIGSITKTFTTSALALLSIQNQLRLDDPIQRYLPSTVSMPQKNGKQITLLNLATARSGLPRMPGNFAPLNVQNPYIDYTEKELTAFLNNSELGREPGSQYEYSNLGMGLLGYALTRQQNMTYGKMIRQMIWSPLEMKQTFISGDTKSDLLAAGHVDKNKVSAWTWDDKSVLVGAGGIVSNVEDMMKYLIAQLSDEKTELHQAFRLAHQERTDAGKLTVQMGLGWHIMEHKYVFHNGGTGGFRSFAGFDPEQKRAIVILVNSTNAADDLGLHWLNSIYPLKTIKKTVQLDSNTLSKYVGVYEIAPQFKITISLEGESLMLQATGQPKVKLHAEGQDKFFLKVVDARIEFANDKEGKIEKLTLYQSGAALEGKKILN